MMPLCCIRNIHMETPYKIDRLPNQLHYTYLDTFGRPVLVATKNNLVEHHIQDLVVRRFTRSLATEQETVKVVVYFSCGIFSSFLLSWINFILSNFCFLNQIHYNFNKILMLQEPLLVVGAFYILFFTVIIYVRLDFAITKVWRSMVVCF